jgi:hypothetical protein
MSLPFPKITDTENNFIKAKIASDTRGWLETGVALANSCPWDSPVYFSSVSMIPAWFSGMRNR